VLLLVLAAWDLECIVRYEDAPRQFPPKTKDNEEAWLNFMMKGRSAADVKTLLKTLHFPKERRLTILAKMSPRKIFCDWKNSWLCLPNIFEKLNKNRLNIKNKEKNIKKTT